MEMSENTCLEIYEISGHLWRILEIHENKVRVSGNTLW